MNGIGFSHGCASMPWMKSVYLAYVLNLLNVHVSIKTNQLLLLNAAVYVNSHVVMEYRLILYV